MVFGMPSSLFPALALDVFRVGRPASASSPRHRLPGRSSVRS
jgi:hypothetical protein